ncbi:CDP-diacylglycerol--serine O-phosphatidyltransferase [Sinimarinibacterium sp. NLF-5-8]|nr:CDP-diacylglycerol--serine O-phosphatidyltransferase [Sinimarinibacterium sp. NLF-5-8]
MDETTPGTSPRKGIYLLPNLFTTGTLFGGFYAIVQAMGGHFEAAAAGILAAMIADGLDGRIARLTHTQSDFGKEYDSICDMVAFGVAPAILMYAFSLHHFEQYAWLGGKLGWAMAFLYCACAALRLARFNVLAAIAGSNKDFFGLPSPSAAASVAFFAWMAHSWEVDGATLLLPCSIVTMGCALLMVSNIRYNSFKQLHLSRRGPFIYMVALIGVFTLVLMNPPVVLFGAFFLYTLSGPATTLWRRMRRTAGV